MSGGGVMERVVAILILFSAAVLLPGGCTISPVPLSFPFTFPENKSRADPFYYVIFELVIEMTRNVSVVLYILVLIAVVVSVDVLFFRNRFWERLMVNIGIVLIFAAFYLRFLKNP
jgi:hypothetical protein